LPRFLNEKNPPANPEGGGNPAEAIASQQIGKAASRMTEGKSHPPSPSFPLIRFFRLNPPGIEPDHHGHKPDGLE
jgi:hypothetical protein